MRKLFTLLSLCACSLTSFAYDSATEGTVYYGSHCAAYGLSDGTVAISTYYLQKADTISEGVIEVTLPATIQVWDDAGTTMTAEYEVSQVGYSTWKNVWFSNSTSTNGISAITKLTISEGIKVINSEAFGWGATSLEEVTLPSTMTTLYPGAFAACDKLTKITCNAATAPTLDKTAGWDKHFSGSDTAGWDYIVKNCKVIVPEGAAASYNQTGDSWTYWGSFYENHNIREAASFTVNANGYTTYYNDYGYVMPEGVEGYMITGVDNGVATLTKIYEEGDYVCDKIALLLKSTHTIYKKTTRNFEVLASGGNTATWPMYDESTYYTNLLSGAQTEQEITPISGGSYYYYILKDDGSKGLAFYWGATDGGVFTNAAHNAYLSVDQSKVDTDASRVLFITKTGTATVDNVTYDLYSNGEAIVTSTITDSYLRGGDISRLNYVESFGTKFYDANNTGKDPLLIMKQNGCNVVRLRLYNNPGTAVVSTDGNTYRVSEGYQDSTDVLNLAKRAKKLGMKIVLSFHYSDFWSDALKQIKPVGWKSYDIEALKKAIYDYTYNFLQKMNAQGTAPDYVALGNEIRSGILFGLSSSKDAVNGSTESGSNLSALLSQGSAAVRAACPEAKIILHLPYDSNFTVNNYKTFLNNYASNVEYDVVGASYYPYYTNAKPDAILPELANAMSKPVMVMETGYSWTQYLPEGRAGANQEGQLHTNGTAYAEATEAGQKTFMEDLQSVIKNNSNILGYLYWDPIMVDQQVNGSWIKDCWAEIQTSGVWYENGNTVSNTTLFNYEGKALSAFEAIKEDATILPSSIEVEGTTYTVGYQAPVVIVIPTGIKDVKAAANNREPLTLNIEPAYYNALGQRVNAAAKGLVIENGKKVIR